MNKGGKILDRTVKRKAKLGLIVVWAVLLLTVIALPVLAANGDGGGDSKDEPLSLVSANPADGQQDVSLKVKIHLSFNKNVVNMSVKENNQKCFTLYSANNDVVPVNVVIADDQMEPEKKRDIVLIPLRELQPAIAYTVKVAPELKSKSGETLGKQLAITFVTAETTPKEKSDLGINRGFIFVAGLALVAVIGYIFIKQKRT